jgi:hypothetical protein
MPRIDLSENDKMKYSNITLAVVQSVKIDLQAQKAGIYLGQALPSRQIWLSAGNNPRQVSTIKVEKPLLPNGGGLDYQPVFEIAAGVNTGHDGWKIESISILGHMN